MIIIIINSTIGGLGGRKLYFRRRFGVGTENSTCPIGPSLVSPFRGACLFVEGPPRSHARGATSGSLRVGSEVSFGSKLVNNSEFEILGGQKMSDFFRVDFF